MESTILWVLVNQLHITDNFTLVANQKRRVRVGLELANKGVIRLGCDQLIEHLHGWSKKNPQVRLTCLPPNDFRKKRFTGAGISDQDDVGPLIDKIQIQQMQDFAFHLLSGLMMIEVERLNPVPRLQFG